MVPVFGLKLVTWQYVVFLLDDLSLVLSYAPRYLILTVALHLLLFYACVYLLLYFFYYFSWIVLRGWYMCLCIDSCLDRVEGGGKTAM